MRNFGTVPVLVLLLSSSALADGTSSTPKSVPLSLPSMPEMNDPMLAPPPPPKRVLTSWEEGLSYLRARSTDLKIALDQVLQAEAQTRIALAQYLPGLNANNAGGASYMHQLITRTVIGGTQVAGTGIITTSQVPVPDTLQASLQLQQALINVPAFDQIGIDELAEGASRLSVEAQKRTLALSLANQIVAVVTAERAAEINRVGLRVALEQLEITNRKRALGAATGLDVVRAQQNAANARASLVTGDESLRQAREALGLALGIPEETGVAPNVNISGLASSALEVCHPVDIVDQRSDIAAARVQLQVANEIYATCGTRFCPHWG